MRPFLPNELSRLPRQRLFWISIWILAFWIASAGTSRIPIAGHEVYVAETAQEMWERNDWIVPYYNDQPRLNKPPLNYWLTGAVAWLSGAAAIADWHARAISIVAAVGIALLTARLGRILFRDPPTVSLAVLMVITSLGFARFSHDGRPEMLYAFCCAAGYTAFANGWRRARTGRATGGAMVLMWLSYAAATLAKGPHLPAMLLAACAVFARSRHMGWREAARLFRPLSGLILLPAITLPWWLLMRHRIGAEQLGRSQLGGALLTIDWRQILNPFHFYQMLRLFLPWSLLFPPVLFVLWRRRLIKRPDLLLVLLVTIPALILDMGSQRRWFYMLPLLPALCLLLAHGLRLLARETGASATKLAWWIALTPWILVCATSAFLLSRGICCTPAYLPEAVAANLISWTWLAVLLWRRWKELAVWPDLTGSAALLCVITIIAIPSPVLWEQDRFDDHALALRVRSMIDAQTPIISFRNQSHAYFFYLRHPIPRVDDWREMERILRQHGRLVVIFDSAAIPELPAEWSPRVLDATPKKNPDPKTVIRLELRQSGEVDNHPPSV